MAAALVAMLAATSAPIRAQPEDADLARIRAQVKALQAKLETVRGRAKTTEDELQVIELELDLRTRELAVAVGVRDAVHADQAATEDAILDLESRITRQKNALASRLAAMYRMGRISYLRILLSIDATRNPLEAIGTMSYLVSRDARAVEAFETTRRLLAEERLRLAEQRVQAERAHAEVLARQQAIETARRQKATLLARLEAEQRRSARELEELREKVSRLERLLTLLYSNEAGRTAADVRIEEFKGALAWPARGEVVSKYGRQRSERFATYTINNGIQVEAEPGSAVSAVYAGTVLYAQWFKGYGNLVIVDHGERVFSLYGNTRAVRVRTGDRVAAGQAIAEVGESGEDQHGFLYFEMREDNQPVDPRSWLR